MSAPEQPDLRQRIAQAVPFCRDGCDFCEPDQVTDAVLAVVRDELADRDAENTRLREQVQAARDFADEMADYCSPHGVAALYAQRLTERLDAASAPSI